MDKRLVKPALIAGVLGLLLIGWLMGPADGDGEKAPRNPAGIAREQAWTDCKDAVTAKLKNPGSANFQLTSVTTTKHDSGYDIAGSLTAENDFGVEQQLAFSCKVTRSGTEAQVVRP